MRESRVCGRAHTDRRRIERTLSGAPRERSASLLGIGAALVYVFLWASAYVPSKIGVLASSPLWFLVARFAVAGTIALVIALRVDARFPRSGRAWLAVIALGITGNALYLGFTYEALRHLASGVGAIVASLNPLVLALIAPFALGERLTPLKLIGMLLGFGGVVGVMVARIGTGSADPTDVTLALIGVLASVASTVIFKKYCSDLDLRATTALQLLAASLVLVVPAAILDGAPHAVWSVPLVVSFAYAVLVMSVGASLLWFWLLTHGEASRVSAFYFLTPIFGLAIAYVILREPVGIRDLGGLAAIALGIFVVQRS